MKKSTCYHIAVFVFLCISWEILATYNTTIDFIFPRPSKILMCGLHSYQALLSNCWYTAQGILGGFLLACVLSMWLATLMLVFPSLQQFLHPIFIFIQCTPMFAIAPLIVLWVGWSFHAVILPTTLTILFPLTLTIHQGLTSVPVEYAEQFILLRATSWQTLMKLRIPHALPYIFSALKVAISSAGFATIAGEWVASQHGLGILILESRRNYQMELAFAGLFTLSFLTFLLFQWIVSLETWTFHAFRIQRKSKTKTSKLVWAPLTLVLCILCLAPQWKSKQHPDQTLTDIHVLLDWTPNVNHIPLYVGIEKQFFQNEGIRLHIHKNLETSSRLPYLLLEQTDLTLYHYSGIIRASLKGLPIQIIGRLIDSSLQGFICKDNGNISTLKDLSGQHFGFCLNHANDTSFLLQTLQDQNITPKTIKNVSADLISPMFLGKVDFLYGAFYNIQGEKLKSLGIPIKTFLSDTYHLNTGPQLLLCGKKGTQATQPQVVEALQKALQNSIDFCKQHLDLAFDIYSQAMEKNTRSLQDEYKQWLVTAPLLASSQQQLDIALTQTILENIKTRYPDLREQACHFYLEQLYH